MLCLVSDMYCPYPSGLRHCQLDYHAVTREAALANMGTFITWVHKNSYYRNRMVHNRICVCFLRWHELTRSAKSDTANTFQCGTVITRSIFFKILTIDTPYIHPWRLDMGCLLWECQLWYKCQLGHCCAVCAIILFWTAFQHLTVNISLGQHKCGIGFGNYVITEYWRNRVPSASNISFTGFSTVTADSREKISMNFQYIRRIMVKRVLTSSAIV